jgi:hypothetical protein
MLSLTKMLIGDNYSGDELRYTVNAFSQTDGVAEGRGPVVAWNYTRTCNLHLPALLFPLGKTGIMKMN